MTGAMGIANMASQFRNPGAVRNSKGCFRAHQSWGASKVKKTYKTITALHRLLQSCLLGLLLAGPSSAAAVSYLASGTGSFKSQSGTIPVAVSSFLAASGLQGGNVIARFTIDDSVLDSDPTANAATYRNAVTASSLSFGSLTHTSIASCNPAFPDCSVFVKDNTTPVPNVFTDEYFLRSRNMTVDQNSTLVASFNLFGSDSGFLNNPAWLTSTEIDPGLDALSGLALSIRFLGVGEFFSVEYSVDNLSIVNEANIAAPVPEPETYAMMLAGLGLLGFVARRRKQQQASA